MKELLTVLCLFLLASTAVADTKLKGEAQLSWERINQIRQDKFDLVLPEVMRENGVDM